MLFLEKMRDRGSGANGGMVEEKAGDPGDGKMGDLYMKSQHCQYASDESSVKEENI